jgi:hypothetical protein
MLDGRIAPWVLAFLITSNSQRLSQNNWLAFPHLLA